MLHILYVYYTHVRRGEWMDVCVFVINLKIILGAGNNINSIGQLLLIPLL